MTFLVSINYGGNETEVRVTASSAGEAVAVVKAALPARIARWASVFVG